MVEIVQVKEASLSSELIKAACDFTVAEDVPFSESDLNLVRGCQDVAAIAVIGYYDVSDIDLVRGGQDKNAINMETKSSAAP